jgi:hypothetical protein
LVILESSDVEQAADLLFLSRARRPSRMPALS